ncbi:MAG: NAD(P)/FAD-dependent oxidoreductase [Arenicella sp.]
MMGKQATDVIIAGGGLAGLSLARQLKTDTPDLDIIVVEKSRFPRPNTTAKVGESTVEIGSHYFTETLGMKEHFKEQHLQKHGLRCFFGEPQTDYSQQDELGVSELFGIPTYQMDRGVIENHLHDEVTKMGVNVVDGADTKHIDLGNGKHSIDVETSDGIKQFSGRWLVDAAGRQKLVKNKLGLDKQNEHKGNAVWFRIDKRVVIDEWSDNQEWRSRIKDQGKRWLSTNHLMGPGYWVWIIPLGTGATSIGIVMDDKALADSGIETFDDTMQWLEKHQPKCAQAVSGAKLLDFNLIRGYSYGCTKMFSEEGWGLTGEAGAFTDPFYAPGSDFIALNNTFMTHLIRQSKQGKDIRLDSAVFHIFYNSFFENTLSLYTDQYGGFGDRKMMSIKLLWDYAYYWGVLCLLFYQDSITDVQLMRTMNPVLKVAQALNASVQDKMKHRAAQRIVMPAQGMFLDQYLLPCMTYFNDVLKVKHHDDIQKTLTDNVAMLERIAVHLEDMLDDNAKLTISDDERDLFGDYRLMVLA